MMDHIFSIISMASPFIIAWLAYLFASKRYYEQKEYEGVKQRYLENGLDQIDRVLKTAQSNVLYNYEVVNKFIYSIKMKNDAIKNIERFRKEFENPKDISLYNIPIERIDKLFQNQRVNRYILKAIHLTEEQCQIIDRFLINAYSESGLVALLLRKHHPKTADKEIVRNNVHDLLHVFKKEIEDNYKRFQNLNPIFSFLRRAIQEMERQPFSYSTLDNFHKDRKLCDLIADAIKKIEA